MVVHLKLCFVILLPMDSRTALKVYTLTILCGVITTDPVPQYYPLPFPHHQHLADGPRPPFNNVPQDSAYSGTQAWPQISRNNFSNPNQDFLDPLSQPDSYDSLKSDIPRQLYGVPPPPTFQPVGYPQIYKLDNLIIIANPPQPQTQPQPCIPQRRPPNVPNTGGNGMDDLTTRVGDEPSKCTWAIVACCSPGNSEVRYNCFELLGCSGYFFDNSACDQKIVMAAAKAALDYYSGNANSTTSPGTENNSV